MWAAIVLWPCSEYSCSAIALKASTSIVDTTIAMLPNVSTSPGQGQRIPEHLTTQFWKAGCFAPQVSTIPHRNIFGALLVSFSPIRPDYVLSAMTTTPTEGGLGVLEGQCSDCPRNNWLKQIRKCFLRSRQAHQDGRSMFTCRYSSLGHISTFVPLPRPARTILTPKHCSLLSALSAQASVSIGPQSQFHTALQKKSLRFNFGQGSRVALYRSVWASILIQTPLTGSFLRKFRPP